MSSYKERLAEWKQEYHATVLKYHSLQAKIRDEHRSIPQDLVRRGKNRLLGYMDLPHTEQGSTYSKAISAFGPLMFMQWDLDALRIRLKVLGKQRKELQEEAAEYLRVKRSSKQ